MTVPAGWYADPWGQSELRWWDGAIWTGTTSSAAHPDQSPPSSASGLARLVGGAGRIAVMDVETTGLYSTDRVVEVAVVTINGDGDVEEEFETLINPLRDVGPTWIHGIDATMLRDAPTFADVAQHVAARVDGAVIAGHNVRFDMRMIGHEFERAGIDIDWGAGLDTLSVTGCKLAQACSDHGIVIDGAHRALFDARATVKLMLAVSASLPASCMPAMARPLVVTTTRICRREGLAEAEAPAPYVAALARGIHTSVDVAPYVGLLDVAIADLRLTGDERRELHALAADLGLDERAVARAHREFLTGLIDAAIEDSIVTDEELDQLCRAAALLDIDIEHVARRTDPYRATTKAIELFTGLCVCFTGQGRDSNGGLVDRATQAQLAEEHGLVVMKSITKKGPDLLVAADGDTRVGESA